MKPERFSERVKQYSEKRISMYNAATASCPQARHTERALLMDRLNLAQGQTICDTMAGGGYLSDGITERLQGDCDIICIEPSENFAASINRRYIPVISNLHALSLGDDSVDRVCNLAGIHHLDLWQDFFSEAFRVLKPGGRFAIADVLEGTPTAEYLNGPVDQLSDIGHDGSFLKMGQLSDLLERAGFVNIKEEHHEYTWDFPDLDTLVHYCKALFRLTKADLSQVHHAVSNTLQITETENSCHMHWSLLYANGDKPA